MNPETLKFISTYSNIFFISSILIMVWSIYKKILNIKYSKSFSDYIAVLDYNMDKAYEIIHKDRILAYSLDGQRVRDEDFDNITRDFVNLVIKLLGPMLYAEFLSLYGDQDTFIFNITEYFNTRYENDEIRKNSLESLSEEDQIEEKNYALSGPTNNVYSKT